jgi:hypothetical protein
VGRPLGAQQAFKAGNLQFKEWLIRKCGVRKLPPSVPPWIIGAFERLVAFALVYFHVKDAPTILALWIGAKLAANWQRRDAGDKTEEARQLRARTFIALMVGTVSVLLVRPAGQSRAAISGLGEEFARPKRIAVVTAGKRLP